MCVTRELPQFVPQKVCLSCDGCCRFKEQDSPWRPKLSAEEIDSIRCHGFYPWLDAVLGRGHATAKWRPEGSSLDGCGCGAGGSAGSSKAIFLKELDENGYLKTVARHGQIQCVFLHSAGDNMCHVYEHRPFECRLYPFLLIKEGDDVKGTTAMAVGLHLSCPYVQGKRESADFKTFVGQLEQYFQRRDVLGFVRKSQCLFGDYSGCEKEIEELFALAL